MPRTLLFLALLLLSLASAHAQLEVGLNFKRRIYLRGEVIETEVTIRNLSGHDVVLKDADNARWFGFEVLRGVDAPIGPFEPNYQNPPQLILAGESLQRTVDLNKLFPVNELGTYKVRATIYFSELKKYLVSAPLKLDISNGKTVWSQTVGVPNGKEGAGQYREVSLITFQKPNSLELYARVEDQATANVLATYPLGHIMGGATAMGTFNDDNTLFAFHMSGPSQYSLSKIGVNGEWLGQIPYASQSGRAAVLKKPDGSMVVVGAKMVRAPAPGAMPVPKLSDRPIIPPVIPSTVTSRAKQ